MSSIVLSAAVRQNLLSLQQTAGLMAQTQNNLSTGNKVNSALDNPTNFFTAQGLNNRGSDVSNLLDVISNGIQVIQSANTAITSVQSLVSQAKSIANQALQSPIGYAARSSVTSVALTKNGVPITADDLNVAPVPGGGSLTTVTGTALSHNVSSAVPIADSTPLSQIFAASDQFKLNGVVISFNSTSGDQYANKDTSQGFTVPGSAQFDLTNGTATLHDLLGHIANQGYDSFVFNVSGAGAISINNLSNNPINSNGAGDQNGTPLEKIGIGTLATSNATSGTGQPATVGGTTSAAVTPSSLLTSLSSPVTTSDSLSINGHAITFVNSGGTSVTASGGTIDLSSATVQTVMTAFNTVGGATSSESGTNGAISVTYNNAYSMNGTVLAKLGLSAVTASGGGATVPQTLSFAAVGNGVATTVTFGDGTGGTVKTLDQLNTALAANNLQATLSTSGQLTISTTNDNASATIGTIGGTAFSAASGAFYNKTVSAPIADTTSQATRANLVNQYNALLTQIDQTSADASFNGVNLLAGDQLQLTFNETGKSKLSITGGNFTSAGLGLTALASTAFKDNAATNTLLSQLNTVTSTLRSQASALGSNLSIVQTRQDFNKNLINVLQTGSANLTQADINFEAANSQALSTRQSLSVSALSLANQSQQSVLQLLR